MTKKKSLLLLSILTVVFILFFFGLPYFLYIASLPSESKSEYPYKEAFISDYAAMRERFLSHQDTLGSLGYTVSTSSYAIDATDELYIDTMLIDATDSKDNLIVITTGVHGIEGYIGSTMLEVFIDRFLPTLDTSHTGVLMLTNINPYGVKYGRRYNENNVDLNRNFVSDWSQFDLDINTYYPQVQFFLEPQSPIGNMAYHELSFLGSLGQQVITEGVDTLTNALLNGQFRSPKGVYYGGVADEKSTTYIKSAFADVLQSDYKNIIHLDLHSGYGPRYNMTIFNSAYEKMTEAETVERFNYDTVIAYDSEDFYATTGDITEYFYRLHQQTSSTTTLYSTCLEFGTLGDDFLSSVQSMKYTIDENRNHFYPTTSNLSEKIIHQRYNEMFFPSEAKWREKAVNDFIQATTGILNNKLK